MALIKYPKTQGKIGDKEKKFRIFLVLTLISIVCLIGMFIWQQVNKWDITAARASGFTESISLLTGNHSYQSEAERNLVKIDNFVRVAEKVIIVPILIFGMLSGYYYKLINKRKKL